MPLAYISLVVKETASRTMVAVHICYIKCHRVNWSLSQFHDTSTEPIKSASLVTNWCHSAGIMLLYLCASVTITI